MNQSIEHLIIIEGPEKGRKISLENDTVRVGRSSNNDIQIKDPVMSRFHCRFSFKSDGDLWIEDLGSANSTQVNNKDISEQKINVSDIITIGDTKLKVLSTTAPAEQAAKLFQDTDFSGHGASGAGEHHKNKKYLRLSLVTILILSAFGATIIWFNKALKQAPESTSATASAKKENKELEIYYTKVQASPKNIFRYEMELNNGKLNVKIDDIANNRHIPKNQNKPIEPDLRQTLIEEIESSDFFELNREYKGLANDIYDVWDLSITIGNETYRTVVENTSEPKDFKLLRQTLEEFALNELGLAALSISKDELLKLAEEKWLLARDLYAQKQIKHGNLAQAISTLQETEWYLETIEPKPEYYQDVIAKQEEWKRELNDIYEDYLFQANRAIKLREWETAAEQLKIICRKVPDRSDERHKKAERKLIDVERRLKRQ
jgi:hypothetical protein